MYTVVDDVVLLLVVVLEYFAELLLELLDLLVLDDFVLVLLDLFVFATVVDTFNLSPFEVTTTVPSSSVLYTLSENFFIFTCNKCISICFSIMFTHT